MAKAAVLANSRGQALVEAAFTAPLILLFLFTVIWFARVALTWQQITGAARLGTDLIAYTTFDKTNIENNIVNYLCHSSNIGRILDKEKLDVKIEINDINKMDFSLDVGNILNLPDTLFASVETLKPIYVKKSSVEITYKYKIPTLLRIAGKENIELKAKSEVLSGTGVKTARK